MESAECSLDELLCQSLSLFRQYRFYDVPGCGAKASRLLEEAYSLVTDAQSSVDMAKWGCVMECLAQKFYIDSDTDTVLGDVDTVLIARWKKIEKSPLEAFSVYLWFGYYFLLRFRNRESRFHSRSKQAMSGILSFLTEVFRKVARGGAPMEVLSHFSADAWGETVCWMEQVCDIRLCEKQSAVLLEQLYNLKNAELEKKTGRQDILLQHILEFYCF